MKNVNPFNAGKSMLKMKELLAGQTIHELKSFSPDSYTNILKLKQKLPFKETGLIPLNSDAVHNTFLDDLIVKDPEYRTFRAEFKSQEAVIEGAKRMDAYFKKIGEEKAKSKIIMNSDGKFELHVPNYKITIPKAATQYKMGGLLPSMQYGGMTMNLSKKEIEQYVKGGYIIEEV